MYNITFCMMRLSSMCLQVRSDGVWSVSRLSELYLRCTMIKKTVEQLYKEHNGRVSDRWSSYLPQYERILNEYRDKPVRLLEIGIQNGGSLELWAKYFPNAQKLVGCDINPDCARLSYEDS